MNSTKPRLLVLASTYPRWEGDPEPGFVHELSRRLTDEFEVYVLSPHALGAKLEECLDGVRVHRFRYAPAGLETLVQGGGIVNNLKHYLWKWLLVPLFMTGLTWRTAREIRQLKPDLLHVHWIVPQGLALLVARLLLPQLPRFLLTSHGGDLFGLRGPMMARLKGWVMRHADAISVVSTPMTRFAVELGADAAKISIIPMGVDFGGLFTPGVGDTRKSGEILFVGRLVEKKGLKYLIQAMPLISVRVPHAHLTIAGYGPEEHSLRGLVAQMGLVDKVAFLGAVPQRELPNLYRGASVFVAPFVQVGSGDQEGLPVALMEAIACGCPVVAGELEVLADIFTQDEADMQVDPRDTKAFADKVAGVLLHGGVACRRMTRIRARLAARLAWDTIARQYAGILNGLLPSAKAER